MFAWAAKTIGISYGVDRSITKVTKQCRDIWNLQNDNMPCRTSLADQQFLVKNQTLTIPQPPYSPYLIPCDLWLFPILKIGLKGHCFATKE
jgi:hypothetical protein